MVAGCQKHKLFFFLAFLLDLFRLFQPVESYQNDSGNLINY